jgi:8-amino-7-oxononanoate synthase
VLLRAQPYATSATEGPKGAVNAMNPLAWIDDELAALERKHLLRELPAPLSRQAAIIECNGRRLVNFASNDYLGLAGDERLVKAAAEACLTSGVGRGSSPLICGRSELHEQLERRLAEFEGTEAALLFPSGFAANSGVIPALVDRGDAIYADSKNHASLIDGCRLSRAETHVYPHGNVDALERLLQQSHGNRRKLIVTDTLFSMDGDLAPLGAIAAAAASNDAMLLLDEAHATGVFGAHGRGVAEALAVEGEGVIRVGTLSKALGAAGGFVCGSRSLIQWLANRARSYVFSTAQPAAICAAALAAIDIVVDEPRRRIGLLQTAAQLRQRLQSQGWNTGLSRSQIIPLMVGSAANAVRLSASLRERGYWLPAIRPPSVPEGESLLRLSLTAAHTPEMLDDLLTALGNCAQSQLI